MACIFQKMKQNKVSVLSFLLVLVIAVVAMPITAVKTQAVTIDATSGDTVWETGDSFTLHLVNQTDSTKTETHTVTYDGTAWSKVKSSILPAYAFAHIGNVENVTYSNGEWDYTAPTLPADQSDAAKLTAADVMTATGTVTRDTALNLTFTHYFARVTFNVTYKSEFNITDKKIKEFVVNNKDGVKAFAENIFDSVAQERTSVVSAILAPETYTAREALATVTHVWNIYNDYSLTVITPENGIILEAGKHYTFDLALGKDNVKITAITVNGDFPVGWSEEVNLDGSEGTIGTEDAGKTAWEAGDVVAIILETDRYGKISHGVQYTDNKWDWATSDFERFYRETETPTISAFYSPHYFIGGNNVSNEHALDEGSFDYGDCEWIEIACSLADSQTVALDFTKAVRNYSRLRIAGEANTEYKVTVTSFVPAGDTAEAGTYTLKADSNGNMFLYGTWKKGSVITVNSADGTTKIIEHTVTVDRTNGKSYALCTHSSAGNIEYTWSDDLASCTANGTCSKCGKAIEETVTAVLDAQPDTSGNYYHRATFTNSVFAAQNRLSYSVANGTYNVYDSYGLLAWRAKAASDLTSNLTLMADIDMTNAGNWEPFGQHTYEYTGTVEGNNHTITGLTINVSRRGTGFIGYLGAGTVRNLHLRSSTIINNTSDSEAYTGGIVGSLKWGSIVNCSVVNSTVSNPSETASRVGGIVGNVYGSDTKVIGCYNEATISGYSKVGGIAGANDDGQIIGCYNMGDITQTGNWSLSNAGGIVGNLFGTGSVSACYNVGNMTNCKTAPGGIIGTIGGSGTADDCYWAVAANASQPTAALGDSYSSTATVNATQIIDGNWTAAMTAMNKAITTWNGSNSNACAYHYEINTGDDAATRPLILVAGAPTAQ